MKVVILGASSSTSLGYYLGQYLEHKNASVVYASRSGKLGVKCNVTNDKQVASVLSKYSPDLVIYAAGVFNTPQLLGSFDDTERAKNHILVKSFGALILANVVSKTPSIKQVIVLGGRATSSDPGFAAYSIGNGALWALVSFFAKHNHTSNIFYIDLPLIKNTTMEQQCSSYSDSMATTETKDVTSVVEKILKNKYKNGSRIVINKKSKL